jgi:hypothetical protein
MKGDELYAFDWSELVPQVVHPLRVMIIEALRWIDQPLSPSDLRQVFALEFGLSTVSYHVNKLAAAGVLVPVRRQPVRGSVKTYFFFPKP